MNLPYPKCELLAPGGDITAIKAALVAGADAIYCGLNRFNARQRANNITINELPRVVKLVHSYDCKIYITLNTIIIQQEISAIISC